MRNTGGYNWISEKKKKEESKQRGRASKPGAPIMSHLSILLGNGWNFCFHVVSSQTTDFFLPVLDIKFLNVYYWFWFFKKSLIWWYKYVHPWPPSLRDSIQKDKNIQLLSNNCLGVISPLEARIQDSVDKYRAGSPWVALSSPPRDIFLHQERLCKHRPQPPDPSSHVRLHEASGQ